MDPVKQGLEDYFPLEIADSQGGVHGNESCFFSFGLWI
jgi:hypothetical protein